MVTVYWILGSIIYFLIGFFINMKIGEVNIYNGLVLFLSVIIIWPIVIGTLVVDSIFRFIEWVDCLTYDPDKMKQERRK